MSDLSDSAIWQIVRHYSLLAGVRCRPHDARRSMAMLAKRGGAPMDVIQRTLGHSSIRTTEIYLSGDQDSNAGDYLEL